MANIRRPRHGSLQYWPHVRAKNETPNVRRWPTSKTVKLLGFAGYKVGMTHVLVKDTTPYSVSKGDVVAIPVTVLECPPLKIISIRAYTKTPYGLKLASEVITDKPEKELSRTLTSPKKTINVEEKLKAFETNLSHYVAIRVHAATQPKKAGIGKKRPEILEIALGGNDVKAQYDLAKTLLGKDVRVQDLFKPGIIVDVHAVNKGKGFQGSVKRFGAQLRQHKTEKKRRGIVLGPLRPAKVPWGQILPGKMGYHTRTEYNKEIIFVDEKPEKVNPKGGFLRYGLVRTDYVLIRGSVPGPAKRLIRLVEAIRGQHPPSQFEFQHINTEAKQ